MKSLPHLYNIVSTWIDNNLALSLIIFFVIVIVCLFVFCKDEIIQDLPKSWQEGKEDNFNELD